MAAAGVIGNDCPAFKRINQPDDVANGNGI